MTRKGTFITFDGGEGGGKSTHINALALMLRDCGREVCVCREPGGTRIGEAIRTILLDPDNAELTARAELLLYEAARAQIVSEVIIPALAAGQVVVCDRFCDSTMAYQGYGRGLDLAGIERLNAFSTGGCLPDRTIFLELDPAIGLARATEFGSDRLEETGTDFHRRVHEGFSRIAARYPERIRVVSTRPDPIDTFEAVFAELADVLPDVPSAEVARLLAADPGRYLGDIV